MSARGRSGGFGRPAQAGAGPKPMGRGELLQQLLLRKEQEQLPKPGGCGLHVIKSSKSDGSPRAATASGVGQLTGPQSSGPRPPLARGLFQLSTSHPLGRPQEAPEHSVPSPQHPAAAACPISAAHQQWSSSSPRAATASGVGQLTGPQSSGPRPPLARGLFQLNASRPLGRPQEAPEHSVPSPQHPAAAACPISAAHQQWSSSSPRAATASGVGQLTGPHSSGPRPPLARGVLQLNASRPLGRPQEAPQHPVLPSAHLPAAAACPISVAPAVFPEEQVPPSPVSAHSDSRPSRLENMMTQLSLDSGPVIRQGSSGRRCELAANYIPVKFKNQGVYQYAVTFSPAVDSMGLRRRLLFEHEDIIGCVRAFDGAILFLPVCLLQNEVMMTSVKPTDQEEVEINVKLIKVLPPEACGQLYGVIFRNIMKILKMCPVGRHYYDPHQPAEVPQHKLQVWPGYITSLQVCEDRPLLLVDSSHHIMRTETVLDFLYESFQRGHTHDDAAKQLIGTTIATRYNNRHYQIHDILWDKNLTETFIYHGKQITLQEYYRKQYGKDVDPDQPLLVHHARKSRQVPGAPQMIYLVPELSYLTGLTDKMRNDFHLMQDVQCHTRQTPSERQRALRMFAERVVNSPEARMQLEKWGLQLDLTEVQISGRVLPTERISFRNRSSTSHDWGRNIEKVISPVRLDCWLLLAQSRDSQRVQEFLRVMENVCPALGLSFSRPKLSILSNDRTDTFIRAMKHEIHHDLQLVVCVVSTNRQDRYKAIKTIACVEHPVPSQVILSNTLNSRKPGKLRNVAQKVAMQINCKLGGELWAVDIPEDLVMVVGIDVYHDPSKSKPSVGALVASINRSCTRWFTRVVFQRRGQELIDGLKVCLLSAIRKFHEVRHALPTSIIVFRDGVGDGDLANVARYEVPQFSECFGHFVSEYRPNFICVVVQKRINTRLLLKKDERRSDVENPNPGTVVDHTVTRREWYDFFLVSQLVRQGTVSPTHYVVVHDSSNWDIDKVQQFTYKMTHLYYNWPGTIRVPAPCQNAHKCVTLVGTLGKEPSHLLSDRLYYL